MKNISRLDVARFLESHVAPGQCYQMAGDLLWQVDTIVTPALGAWHPADSILENIPGAAFEWGWTENPMTGNFTFHRLERPCPENVRTYVSPDRRHLYSRTRDGLFVRVHADPKPKFGVVG